MKKVFVVIMALAVAGCGGAPGPNAPLQLTHNADTVIQASTPDTAAGRQVVAQCFDAQARAEFARNMDGGHYGAYVVGHRPLDGTCYWAWFKNLPNQVSAETTVLGICQNEGVADCTVAAVAVPEMTIPIGARTVSGPVSEFLTRAYLNAPGYSAAATTENGFLGLATDQPDQATADRIALQRCAEDLAEGSGWNLDDPDRASRIYRAEPEICEVVNRRDPDGVMTPRVLN